MYDTSTNSICQNQLSNNINNQMPKTTKNRYDQAQLRSALNLDQYQVTRRRQTQQPFTNQFWNFFGVGVYRCIVCSSPLFLSEHKYEDGFGWPAFYDEHPLANIKKIDNHDLDYVRSEAVCAKCNSHIGFIFADGPVDKTGTRYSVNSAALAFEGTD